MKVKVKAAYMGFLIAYLITLAMLMSGCARFSTRQTDMSYDEQGKPQRQITTEATAYALFSANSALTKFKASQTDKTQSATVGSLNQEANATNYANMFEAVARGIASGLNPIPKP